MAWQYFESPGTMCNDGSPAGFSVNHNPAATKLDSDYTMSGGAPQLLVDVLPLADAEVVLFVGHSNASHGLFHNIDHLAAELPVESLGHDHTCFRETIVSPAPDVLAGDEQHPVLPGALGDRAARSRGLNSSPSTAPRTSKLPLSGSKTPSISTW